MTRSAPTASLQQRAREHGIETAYTDGCGVRHEASEEVLVEVLEAFDARGAIDAGEPELDPVIVAWGGAVPAVRLPEAEMRFTTEAGETSQWRASAGDTLDLEEVPIGYHELVAVSNGAESAATVISAPRRVRPPGGTPRRGLMAPTYALDSSAPQGVGTFASLARFADWIATEGGSLVATLPILATFCGVEPHEPFSPGPYGPVSRLFWNEVFVDVSSTPEFERIEAVPCAPEADLVDYRRAAQIQHKLLGRLLDALPGLPARHAEFEHWLDAHPDISAYASFRAERPDGPVFRRHAYGQFLADQALDALVRDLRERDVALYLDLPIGVHPSGFDARERDGLYLAGMRVGAPPDPVFADGQNWEFPPMSPSASRRDGHRFFARCLRHHMRIADFLRIDHIMGLHRLFWIPENRPTSEGVYVRYPAEELYAVLSIESHRNQCHIIGEDLGTVPEVVRTCMGDHGISRMHLVEYELDATDHDLDAPPAQTLGGLNTHDMAPFAAFWRDADDGKRRRLTRYLAARGHKPLGSGPVGVLDSVLDDLHTWPSCATVVAAEDLWFETEPQNVPGTEGERANWRHKFRYSFDDISNRRDITMRARRLFGGIR